MMAIGAWREVKYSWNYLIITATHEGIEIRLSAVIITASKMAI